jgi:hypothetical protein
MTRRARGAERRLIVDNEAVGCCLHCLFDIDACGPFLGTMELWCSPYDAAGGASMLLQQRNVMLLGCRAMCSM